LKKPIPGIKVFIDTSVLIAGVASVTGASATVLDLCEAESIQMVISRQVLVEADRNFSSKLPGLVTQFRQFIRNVAPHMVEDPPAMAVERAAAFTVQKDASILAAAVEAQSQEKRTHRNLHPSRLPENLRELLAAGVISRPFLVQFISSRKQDSIWSP
jgi:predicted nucleic acid-binding protein